MRHSLRVLLQPLPVALLLLSFVQHGGTSAAGYACRLLCSGAAVLERLRPRHF